MSPPAPKRPTLYTVLREYPWILLRFRCHYCERVGDERLADCVAQFGTKAPIGRLLRAFIAACPWDPHSGTRKPQKYGMKCGAYMPDIGRVGPPDLPPALLEWRLIEGGKADMLPAEPGEPTRRRRVGEDSDV
ncbi:hypothetical protein [Bosea vestrisii]|uniref:Uncharacterized protein n=1 Tax=Bosea vestrisii TaxID=151416 RepID=A0ABW0H5J9_9HYPH